jgi:hypothetical protein
MEFCYDELVTYPVSRVYPVLRDELVQLPPYLPGVDRIELIEREALSEGRTRIDNKWFGNSSSAPPPVRPFITGEMTTWIDHALWQDEQKKVEWTFETVWFGKLYDCSGVNYFEDAGEGKTRIRLTGTIQVYPERVPGVPKLLARRLRPQVEKYLIQAVTPNLAQLPKALQAFLDTSDDAVESGA